MARISFKFFTPRDKPPKRGPRQHKKNKNKSEKDSKNRQDTKARVDKHPIRYYIERMKEIIEYNKSLLEVADQKLKRLIKLSMT
jgi:hypothetical protein